MSETTLEVEDGVAVFTLNRPDKMNAISQDMFEHDLPDMVARVTEDDDIRVLILRERVGISVPAPMSRAWAARTSRHRKIGTGSFAASSIISISW